MNYNSEQEYYELNGITRKEAAELAESFEMDVNLVNEDELGLNEPALDVFYKVLFMLTSKLHCDDICINKIGKSIVYALFNQQIIINIFTDNNEFMFVTIENFKSKKIPIIHINKNFNVMMTVNTMDKIAQAYYLFQHVYEHLSGITQPPLSSEVVEDLLHIAILKGRVFTGLCKSNPNLTLSSAQLDCLNLYKENMQNL